MGSCVSHYSSASTPARFAHSLTAKVVDLDGAMAQFAAPITAREALAAARRAASHFLCCSDEFYFDAPSRAVAADDALRAGQLYFALPVSMLRRPLSGQDMAALAVKASAAPVVAAADVGRAVAGVPSQDKSGGAAGNRQQRRQTGRVAPLDVVSGDGSGRAGGEWKDFHHVYGGYDVRKAVYSDRTVGKARNGVGYKGVIRRLPAVQSLSVIVEAAGG